MSSAFAQQGSAYDLYADSLRRIGQVQQIIPYFKNELLLHPGNEQILRNLGYYSIELNNPIDGEKYYRQALAVNPGCARCHLNLGRALLQQGDKKRAMEEFNTAIGMDPKDSSMYMLRAELKAANNDKFGALTDYNKGVQLAATNPAYYFARGGFHEKQGNNYMALEDYKTVILLDSTQSEGWYRMASILFNLGEMEESLRATNRAISHDSTNYSMYLSRAAIYFRFNQAELALSDYNRAILLEPRDYYSYSSRADLQYKLENMDAYCQDLSKSRDLLKMQDPANEELKTMDLSLSWTCDSTGVSYYFQRGIASYNLGHFRKAVDHYTRGLKKFPGNCMSLSFRGNAFLALNDYTHALEDYYASIANKANLNEDLKHSASIQSSFDSATYAAAFISNMYLLIAECKYGQGLMQDALTEINTGIRLFAPMDSMGLERYYNMRGNIYLAMGKYAFAQQDFMQCLDLNPAFNLALVNLAIAKASQSAPDRISKSSIKVTYDSRGYYPSWSLPVRKTVKKDDSNLLTALSDCNAAISREPGFGFAWYVRGQIQRALGEEYCKDFKTARDLEYPVAVAEMAACLR